MEEALPARTAPRTISPPEVVILPATDLGNVEVAKEGNLYLLTDPRGDIRPDGRGLGLYDLDTRILSTSILRLNGTQLTLLRGPHRDGGIETIQLTNPEYRGNPADRRGADRVLARRELSVTRSRQLNGALQEQVAFESYSEADEVLVIELGFGVDMADIFEVRGYPRSARGTLCPIELHDDRIVFGYDGLDGRRRTTTIRLDGARLGPLSDQLAWPGATVGATWHLDLPPGRRLTIGWDVSFEIGDPPVRRGPTRSTTGPPGHAGSRDIRAGDPHGP